MIKHIALFRRPATTSRPAFFAEIEASAARLDLPPELRPDFRRNHVVADVDELALIVTLLLPPGRPAGWARLADPALLIDSFAAEEHRSAPAALGVPAPPPDDPAAVKAIAFMRRRTGMTRKAFIDYYETRHAPLAERELRSFARYHRSYRIAENAGPADVMTEFWYRNQAECVAVQTALADPAIGALFAADEAKLFDRASIRAFLVDERAG